MEKSGYAAYFALAFLVAAFLSFADFISASVMPLH
jgi:hypothetical protein